MKSILVATDLSVRSDRALHRALNLAKSYKARLTILYVIDEDTPEILHKDLGRLAKKQIFSAVEGKTQNVDYKVEIVTGIPHIKILQTALKNKADLVVLGLHRHANKKGSSMMGNAIERVVKDSLKPVLVVSEHSESEYKKILVGFDFNSHSKNSLKLALSLFPNANFTLAHSYYMPLLGAIGVSSSALESEHKKNCEKEINETLTEVTKGLSKSGIKNNSSGYKVKIKLENGSIIDILRKEALYSKAQLMVIGTHGRSGISKMLSLNVAETFLIDPPCDVLVMF